MEKKKKLYNRMYIIILLVFLILGGPLKKLCELILKTDSMNDIIGILCILVHTIILIIYTLILLKLNIHNFKKQMPINKIKRKTILRVILQIIIFAFLSMELNVILYMPVETIKYY